MQMFGHQQNIHRDGNRFRVGGGIPLPFLIEGLKMFEYNKPIFEQAGVTHWHNKGLTGKGITIAVLDTKHKAYDFQNVVEPIQPIFDTFGHSTGVFGVFCDRVT